MPGWIFIGAGSYNRAYKSTDGKEVLKIRKADTDDTDTPERSVRLWNMINSHIHPPARLVNTEFGEGWVCPFIEGVQASDKEMADAVIDVFNKTGRIVVDATAPKNFVKTPNGQIVCVDIGMALQLEKSDAVLGQRRKSIVSRAAWGELSDDYMRFFKSCSNTNPITIDTVKALLFIQEQRPDLYDVSFLKNRPAMVRSLATAFDMQRQGLDMTPIDINPNLAIFTLPKRRLDDEIKKFTQYLEKNDPSSLMLLGLIVIRELPNHDNGKNVNIEISDSKMTLLFTDYLAAERQKLIEEQQKLQQERALAEEMLVAHFEEKIDKINMIQRKVNEDSTLSNAEKEFLNKHCEQLKMGINDELSSIEENCSLESIKGTRRLIDNGIDAHMEYMFKASMKLSISNRCKGFINDICEALGITKPFTMTYTKVTNVVVDMKERLKDVKEPGVKTEAKLDESHATQPTLKQR